MRKGAVAGVAFAAGFASWFVYRTPPAVIVRVKPSDRWTDMHGYEEGERILPVSKSTLLLPEICECNEYGTCFYDGDECEKAGYVQKLTVYEQWGKRFHVVHSYKNLSLNEANRKIMQSHQERMSKTSFLHRLGYEN
jgi:hypothetical protein